MVDTVNFFNRNWIRALENVLRRRYYPGYQLVDSKRVGVLQTKYGAFHFSKALQTYYNLFEQIETYKVDDLQKTDVVLDIGANIGAFTVLAAPKVRHVIAVEPLFCGELKMNIELNKLDNVRLLPYALGWVSPFSEHYGRISFCGEDELVQYIEFKDILASCPERPNFLKIDCEGGEWSLRKEDLEGFRAVEAEVHNFDNKNPVKFLEMLEYIGFDCVHSITKEGQMMISARRA